MLLLGAQKKMRGGHEGKRISEGTCRIRRLHAENCDSEDTAHYRFFLLSRLISGKTSLTLTSGLGLGMPFCMPTSFRWLPSLMHLGMPILSVYSGPLERPLMGTQSCCACVMRDVETRGGGRAAGAALAIPIPKAMIAPMTRVPVLLSLLDWPE